jgi:hypothetical protein
VLVIAVQNSVDYRDLGVATSGATLFRLIGGSIGTSIFGAIFAAGLDRNLERLLPGVAGAQGTAVSPQMIDALEPAIRALYVQAFTASLRTVFLAAAAVALVGFVLTWFVPERPLRESVAAVAGDVGKEAEDLFPMPGDLDSVRRLERALSLTASRDVKKEYIRAVVSRAGLDLSPLAAWLLVRLEPDPSRRLDDLSRRFRVDGARLSAAHQELLARGLLAEDPGGLRRITPAGAETLHALAAARRAHLREVLAEWEPGLREDLVARLVGGQLTIDN